MFVFNSAESMRRQANRLHHFSMIYAGAVFELASNQKVAGLPAGHPGLDAVRDLADLVLLMRAEINGLVKIMVEGKLVTAEQVQGIMIAEYEWLANQKELFFHVKSTDVGLEYNLRNFTHE